MSSNTIFDICVIGEGIAGQVFLWNLFSNLQKSSRVSKSQKFSIAVVSNDEMAPACTLRSSATVSLNGISDGVSVLGDDMREAYFLFEDFFKKNRPSGVEVVDRVVVAGLENEIAKLKRRYKQISELHSPLIRGLQWGTQYQSYLLSPKDLLQWFKKEIDKLDENKSLERFHFFVQDIQKIEDGFLVLDQKGHEIRAKKLIFATGAFAKIHQHFFHDIIGKDKEIKNEIKAGFYLERFINLGEESFYLTVDGINILYRYNNDNKSESFLQIGSVSVVGAYPITPEKEIVECLKKVKQRLNFEVGDRADFKVISGLRHKAPKRMLEAYESAVTKDVYHLNGFYKNGFSMSFLAAKKMKLLLEEK